MVDLYKTPTASYDYLYPFVRSVVSENFPLCTIHNAFYKLEDHEVPDVLYVWCTLPEGGIEQVVESVEQYVTHFHRKGHPNEYYIVLDLPDGVTQAFEEGNLADLYAQHPCNHSGDNTFSAVVANRKVTECIKVKARYLAKKLDLKVEDIKPSSLSSDTLHIKPVHSPYMEILPLSEIA